MKSGQNTSNSRGSEWRKWDLHVHTKGTKKNDNFSSPDFETFCVTFFRKAIDTNISAIGITDYFDIDNFKRVREFVDGIDSSSIFNEDEKNKIKGIFLLPNVELRILPATSSGGLINIHCLLNPDSNFLNSLDNDFFASLEDSGGNKMNRAGLISLGRSSDSSLTEDSAYQKGIEEFHLEPSKLIKLLKDKPNLKENIIVVVSNSNHDGVSALQNHYKLFEGVKGSLDAVRKNIYELSDAIFSGNPKDRDFFLGKKPGCDAQLVISKCGSLKPCFHGSDAHSEKKLFEPDQSRFCWIKADLTFQGLLQAIKEPSMRSFIGAEPPKLSAKSGRGSYFIDRICINKKQNSSEDTNWLHNTNIPLNHDLVAIIGNKGSGKSALADVIALLGNSKVGKENFSFLKRERFLGAKNEPAKDFTATLTWLDKQHSTRSLDHVTEPTAAELVRYIPQGHFEQLCNKNSNQKDSAFQKELEDVIFDYVPTEDRLGAANFSELISMRESNIKIRKDELDRRLKQLNMEIEALEAQSQPAVRQTLIAKKGLKEREIMDHQSSLPKEECPPSEVLTPDQQQATNDLTQLTSRLEGKNQEKSTVESAKIANSRKKLALKEVKNKILLLRHQYGVFLESAQDHFSELCMTNEEISETFKLVIDETKVSNIENDIATSDSNLEDALLKIDQEIIGIRQSQSLLSGKLARPYQVYQDYLKSYAEWSKKNKELIGSPDVTDSLEGLTFQIERLDGLPASIKLKDDQRRSIAEKIYSLLDEQREFRENLFKSVQSVIDNKPLIKEPYKIKFSSFLYFDREKFHTKFFDMIKQQKGEFAGEEAANLTIQNLLDSHDLSSCNGVLSFLDALKQKMNESYNSIGIAQMLKKDKRVSEVYDFLFGLSFIIPKYSIIYQQTEIEQLSPGQRGALLLIFYLMVDKIRRPIILDQPEENLDNETVVNLLVPVLTTAKEERQIFIVTHNPNLAIVCDAEQVIYSSFDRKNKSTISYCFGAIENPEINKHIVNVLEGTMPAFKNRRSKYIDD